MIDSADNESKEDSIGWPGKSRYWFVVGAYDELNKGKAGYSSWGKELDCLMYTDLAVEAKEGYYVPISHTSGATQLVAGMAALLKEHLRITPEEFREFIRQNSIDIGQEGWDPKTGFGLFVLPEKLPTKEVKNKMEEYEKYLTLDIRSESNISARALDKYLEGTPMEGLGAYFIAAEKRYSVNAQYLCAHAIHESDFGRSRIARDKKNLFGFGAYDRNPYESARTFKSFEECIYYVAEYIAENYLSPAGKYYNGPTLKGMNVKYATDPHWAEKIAEHMAKIEEVAKSMKDYEGHWAEAAIEKVKAAGLMSGYPDGSFKPDQPVTRAELAAVLARLLDRLEK